MKYVFNYVKVANDSKAYSKPVFRFLKIFVSEINAVVECWVESLGT